MDNSFAKIFAAAERLGVPAITVINDEPVVVMSIESYEHMMKTPPVQNFSSLAPAVPENVRDLTEEDLFDKINRDIAAWRSAHQEQDTPKMLIEDPVLEPITQDKKHVQVPVARDEDDQFYIEPVS